MSKTRPSGVCPRSSKASKGDTKRRWSGRAEVIYLVFNAGYTATTGEDGMRPALCDEALRLGRMLAELASNESEVLGLVALMELAVGMAFGSAAALEIVDALAAEPALRAYQWLPSVRGDLLAKFGRHAQARAEFERAAALARNVRERALLLDRAQGLTGGP